MGSYIHAFAERRHNGRWFAASISGLVSGDDHPARLPLAQNYTLFGWLADVRNYAQVPPLTARRGLPIDADRELLQMADAAGARGCYAFSWVSLRELLAFDYDATFEDRRTSNAAGPRGDTVPPGMGERTSYRAALGPSLFECIRKLQALGEPDDLRVVFWFD